MKNLIFGLIVLFILASITGCSGNDTKSNPEGTVREYLDAMAALDVNSVVACWNNEQEDEQFKSLETLFRITDTIEISNLTIRTITQNDVEATIKAEYDIELEGLFPSPNQPHTEIMNLVRVDNEWLITHSEPPEGSSTSSSSVHLSANYGMEEEYSNETHRPLFYGDTSSERNSVLPNLHSRSDIEKLWDQSGGIGEQGSWMSGRPVGNNEDEAQYWDAGLETELSVDAVHNHYVDQLITEGWTLEQEASDDTVSWSKWSFYDESSRQWIGFLLVHKVEEEHLQVYLRADHIPQ